MLNESLNFQSQRVPYTGLCPVLPRNRSNSFFTGPSVKVPFGTKHIGDLQLPMSGQDSVLTLRDSVYKSRKNYNFMQNFLKYMSTAPVLAAVWFGFLAGLLIELNRFFPDPLVFHL